MAQLPTRARDARYALPTSPPGSRPSPPPPTPGRVDGSSSGRRVWEAWPGHLRSSRARSRPDCLSVPPYREGIIPPMRFRISVAYCLLLFLCRIGAADRITLDKPIRVALQKLDKTALAGRVTAYDEQGFTLLDAKNESHQVAWTDLDAHGVFLLRPADWGQNASAWVTLGQDLLGRSDGKEWADRAFDRAMRIDPKSKEQVQAARLEAKSAAFGAASANGPPEAGGRRRRPGPAARHGRRLSEVLGAAKR